MMLTETMIQHLMEEVVGSTSIVYQDQRLDFSTPFKRMSLKQSIVEMNEDVKLEDLDDVGRARDAAERFAVPLDDGYGLGKIQTEIFEKTVESRLVQPTFITEYPAEVSPLARRSDTDPFVTDRFEFFAAGREIANGFSELNDPDDQAARFRAQVEAMAAGDDEAMHFDADYIQALEHGMPPTAGEGIGIDRLVMLLTDSASIRDVLLFPHMRPRSGA
jgi:lysyl-tRNA synthetase class 2